MILRRETTATLPNAVNFYTANANNWQNIGLNEIAAVQIVSSHRVPFLRFGGKRQTNYFVVMKFVKSDVCIHKELSRSFLNLLLMCEVIAPKKLDNFSQLNSGSVWKTMPLPKTRQS